MPGESKRERLKPATRNGLNRTRSKSITQYDGRTTPAKIYKSLREGFISDLGDNLSQGDDLMIEAIFWESYALSEFTRAVMGARKSQSSVLGLMTERTNRIFNSTVNSLRLNLAALYSRNMARTEKKIESLSEYLRLKEREGTPGTEEGKGEGG